MRLRSLFSPLTLTVFFYGPLLVLYLITSSSIFAVYFESRKAFSWSGLVFFVVALAAFAIAAAVGAALASRKPFRGLGDGPRAELSEGRRRSLVVLLEVALVLSIAAYAVWFGIGVTRAGGVLELLDVWRRDPHLVKGELLGTVPGVTTMTQLAVGAIPLAVAFGLANHRLMRGLVIAIFVLATIRAVLTSERLALIELVVPLVFIALAQRRAPPVKVVAAVVAAGITVVSFFAVTELRRTYVYTQDFSVATAGTRFLGYYTTSINNGFAVVDEYPAATPFLATGEFLWQFPVLGDLRLDHLPGLGTVSFRYQDASGIDSSFWEGAFAAQGLDYEFNVLTTPGYLAADFGWLGLVGMLALGAASGALYRRSAASRFYAALYGVWVVGLLEFMRILYFTETRVFPAYLVFLAALLVLRRRAIPTPEALGPRSFRSASVVRGRP